MVDGPQDECWLRHVGRRPVEPAALLWGRKSRGRREDAAARDQWRKALPEEQRDQFDALPLDPYPLERGVPYCIPKTRATIRVDGEPHATTSSDHAWLEPPARLTISCMDYRRAPVDEPWHDPSTHERFAIQVGPVPGHIAILHRAERGIVDYFGATSDIESLVLPDVCL